MPTYEIPTSPQPQTFTIELAGITYRLTLKWCAPVSVWVLDIASAAGVPILTGICVVANVDLLSPYPYLNFGGQLIAQTDSNPNMPPTFNNLGSTGHLYFITP